MAESDLIDIDRRNAGEMMVYASLHRMAADGLIVDEWTVGDGRRRRRYRLTDTGRLLLQLNMSPRLSIRFTANVRPEVGYNA